jgi:hypothetical protein
VSTERKIIISVAVFSLLGLCAALLRGCWFGLHGQKEDAVLMGLLALMLWWVGSACATVLKNNPEK